MQNFTHTCNTCRTYSYTCNICRTYTHVTHADPYLHTCNICRTLHTSCNTCRTYTHVTRAEPYMHVTHAELTHSSLLSHNVLRIKLVASGGTQWLCHWTLEHIYLTPAVDQVRTSSAPSSGQSEVSPLLKSVE